MALSREVNNWPLILCGPMLRRVTSKLVTVFVALKYSAKITLQIKPLAATSWLHHSTPQQTIELGQYLHVCLVTLTPTSDLSYDQVYEYDLEITQVDDGSVSTLATNNLLKGEYALGYTVGALPSFCLPPTLDKLKMVHGSCRLPHGDGWDMLALLDGQIHQDLFDPVKRPQQLLLTGDQIYADDVAPCMLAMLTETGRQLLGWSTQELLPFREGEHFVSLELQASSPINGCPPVGPARDRFRTNKKDYKAGNSDFRAESSDFLTRAELIMGQGELTSEHSDNHLLFFAEFCAMYLMAWSDALWPRQQSAGLVKLTVPEVEEVVTLIAIPGTDNELAEELKEFRAEAKSSRNHLLRYAETVPRVRRLLANIPTAMMFDDHEVTDDWYLNDWWYRSNLANPLSRRVIRNALLAYSVFQDWGNQPAQYQPGGKGWDLLSGIRCNRGAGDTGKISPTIAVVPNIADALLGLPSISSINTAVAPNDRKRWDYDLPGPDWQILFLNTRTWRRFDFLPMLREKAPAELISTEALPTQLEAFDPGKELVFIVSGTPVFGVPLIEKFQIEEAYRKDPVVQDYEAWSSNSRGLEHLLAALIPLGNLVLISGDVHYGFMNSSTFVHSQTGNKINFIQCCSSALKNHFESQKYLPALKAGFIDQIGAILDVSTEKTLFKQLLDHYSEAEKTARIQNAPASEIDQINRARQILKFSQFGNMPVRTNNWPGAVHDKAREILNASPVWHYHLRGIKPVHHQHFLDASNLFLEGLKQTTDQEIYCAGKCNIGTLSFRVGTSGVESITQTLWFDENQQKNGRPGIDASAIDRIDRIDTVVAKAFLKTSP